MPRSAPTVESRARERLTGAAILVTVIVLVVPELLSRPRHAVPHAEMAVDEAPVRSYTLSLGDTQQSAAPLATEAPARVVPQGPVPVTTRAPVPVTTRAPVPVTTRAPVPVTRRAPVPVTRRAPVPVTEAPSPSAIGGAPVVARKPRPAVHEARATAASAGAPRGSPERTESSVHGWAVQVGSFGNRGNADRLVRSLKLKGYGAFVTDSSSRGRTWYRVRVGPARDRAAADALAARLRAAGMRGAVAQPR